MPRRIIRHAVMRLEGKVAEGVLEYEFPMSNANRVYDVARKLIEDQCKENFVVIGLNSRHTMIGVCTVSVGTLTTSLVHPREVFQPALQWGAAAIVCWHNHPSGDPTPSVDDLAITKRLIKGGRLLGIPILDHVVIGCDRFCSIREANPGMFS